MPRGWTSVAHRQQTLEWVARAQALVSTGDYRNAHDAIDEAFRLIDEHGTQQDVVFMATLTVAADSALSMSDAESAASFYLTCANVGAMLVKPGAGEVDTLLVRAHIGLARCDLSRGSTHRGRAPSRYAAAWRMVQEAGIALPAELAEEVRAGMVR